MNKEHKEFYSKYISPSEQMFLRTTAPLSTNTFFGRVCYNNCIQMTLNANEDGNSTNLYSGIIGILFLYE
ncbi:hypothetical protein [Salmonella phage SD-1_S14]|nr:hypothetical protein [Salmonella phage SD-1_S14]